MPSRFRAAGLATLIAEQNGAFPALADRVFTLDGGGIPLRRQRGGA
ncbi:hypothetical protein [Rhodopila sp.]